MTYGIVNKKNIVKLIGQNTTNSRYYVRNITDDSFGWDPKNLPVKRKLATREAARSYKRALKNPQNWSIVNLRVGEVVR